VLGNLPAIATHADIEAARCAWRWQAGGGQGKAILFLEEYIYGQPEQDHGENLLEIGGRDMLYKACSDLGTDDAADTE